MVHMRIFTTNVFSIRIPCDQNLFQIFDYLLKPQYVHMHINMFCTYVLVYHLVIKI